MKRFFGLVVFLAAVQAQAKSPTPYAVKMSSEALLRPELAPRNYAPEFVDVELLGMVIDHQSQIVLEAEIVDRNNDAVAVVCSDPSGLLTPFMEVEVNATAENTLLTVTLDMDYSQDGSGGPGCGGGPGGPGGPGGCGGGPVDPIFMPISFTCMATDVHGATTVESFETVLAY